MRYLWAKKRQYSQASCRLRPASDKSEKKWTEAKCWWAGEVSRSLPTFPSDIQKNYDNDHRLPLPIYSFNPLYLPIFFTVCQHDSVISSPAIFVRDLKIESSTSLAGSHQEFDRTSFHSSTATAPILHFAERTHSHKLVVLEPSSIR